jgi:O-antigen/teichoic acid export membrane protein
MHQESVPAKPRHISLAARLQAALLHRWGLRSSRVAVNSAYMMGSQFSIALLQGLQFFLLARALGSEEFGRIASVVAITSALLPFSGLGLGNMAIMRIARLQARAEVCLGNALAVTTVTAVVAVGLAVLIGTAVLPGRETWILLLLLGISEILLTKYIDVAAHVFFGLEKHRVSALFYNLHMLVRLACAAALCFAWPRPTALAWAQLHLAAGALTAAVVLFTSVRLLGRPRTDYRAAVSDARTGVFFSVTLAARSLQTDVDKSILARSASAATAGVYTAAFRLAYMACMPVFAILLALQARMFQKGHHEGLAGTLGAVRLLALAGGTYCLILAGCMYMAAPAVPWLLGNSYQLSIDILRWLCLLPLFLVFQAICSSALSGADEQRQLGLLHTLTAGMSLLLNILLVPEFGWMGAVMAAYGSQGFLLLSMLVTIALLLQAQRKASR